MDAAEVGADGAFTLSAPLGNAPVIVLSAGGVNGGQVWLHPVEVQSAGQVSVDFSNENLLSIEELRKSVGLPAEP